MCLKTFKMTYVGKINLSDAMCYAIVFSYLNRIHQTYSTLAMNTPLIDIIYFTFIVFS